MKNIFNWVLSHPKLVLLGLLIFTVLAGSQLQHLKSETDIESMLPRTLDAYVNKKVLEERFGAADMVVIGIVNEKEGIYSPGSLKIVAEMTDWMQQQPEFETLALNDLLSLSTIKDIHGTEDGLEVEKFMEIPLVETDEIAHLQERMSAFGVYDGVIVSEDGKGTILVVKPKPDSRHLYGVIYEKVMSKVAEIESRGGPEKFYFSGRPIIESVFGRYMQTEMKRLMPMVIVFLFALLFLAFRSPRGMLLPVGVVLIAEVWTMGSMAFFEVPIYTVTTMLPVLILAIGIADAVHFMLRERLLSHQPEFHDKRERLVEVMHELWKPMLMTSITTGIGFLSLAASDLVPVKFMGLFIAIGILYALLVTKLFLPAMLMLLPDRIERERKPLFSGYVTWLGELVLNRPKRILIGFGLLLLLAVIGLVRLETNASLVAQFKPGDPLLVADTFLNDRFVGTTTLDIMIDTGKTDGLLEPLFLTKLAEMQKEVEAHPMVGDSASIAELLASMNKAMHEDRESWRKVPGSADLAAQYLLLYSFSGAPSDFDTFITSDYRQAHLRVSMKTDETAVIDTLIVNLRSKTAEWFPESEGYSVAWAGTGYTTYRLAELIIRGMAVSLVFSIIAIFLICWWMFKSIKVAGLAMLPVSMAVVFNYGTMGNVGVPLDIATALTGAMALGIGVDFAMHYLYRYRFLRQQGMKYPAAIRQTNTSVGHAILFNAFIIIGGFMVLLGAELYPQMKLGSLVAATMVVCYLASCYLFPVLLGLGLGKEKTEV
ncbi:MAG: MMPL family transporter [Mariprofundaceae bacterium]